VGGEVSHDLTDILTMDAAEPFIRAVANGLFFQAQDFFPARGIINPVCPHIPVPQPVIGTANCQGVPLLAFAQGCICSATVDGHGNLGGYKFQDAFFPVAKPDCFRIALDNDYTNGFTINF